MICNIYVWLWDSLLRKGQLAQTKNRKEDNNWNLLIILFFSFSIIIFRSIFTSFRGRQDFRTWLNVSRIIGLERRGLRTLLSMQRVLQSNKTWLVSLVEKQLWHSLLHRQMVILQFIMSMFNRRLLISVWNILLPYPFVIWLWHYLLVIEHSKTVSTN